MIRFSALLLMAAMVCFASALWGQTVSPVKALKRQQKIARRQLKVQEKIWKKSFHGQRIPRAQRLAVEHQYKRNMRDLKTRQKDELERMKDQERLWKAQQRHSWSGGTMIQ